MENAFTPEADQAIAKAFAWLVERELYAPQPQAQGRTYRQGMPLSEDDQRILRLLAENSGWTERGGNVMRDLEGDAVGRTHWVGQPEWANGFAYDKAEIQNIVEKAIAGQSLGTKQTALFQSMLDALADIQTAAVPF